MQTPAATGVAAGAFCNGGEGEIRTLDTVAGIPVFETGPFSRSGTSPERRESKGQVFVPTSHVRLKELQRREGSSELSINLDATSIRVRLRSFGPHGVILSVERQHRGLFFHDRLDVHRAAPELGQVRQRVPSVV